MEQYSLTERSPRVFLSLVAICLPAVLLLLLKQHPALNFLSPVLLKREHVRGLKRTACNKLTIINKWGPPIREPFNKRAFG